MPIFMPVFRGILAGALFVAVAAAASRPAVALEDTLLVEVDRAKIVKLDQPAATVIIGNPSIADALVHNREMLVVTGKSFGVTNMIVLDASGKTIGDLTLHVRGDDVGIVTVQRGPSRLSYSCAPTCERTLMIGDMGESYSALNTQIQDRIGLATGQAGSN
ncbi:pilus assembly protein N-terminal domain-containing protein [Microbaculum sp. FT89]|uniref:pilus assembly protein N-terminal domain-containing protein n=1 Tax=Microbaculum sp. FT89 TaxID=3447298 RepID=UPI003F539171